MEVGVKEGKEGRGKNLKTKAKRKPSLSIGGVCLQRLLIPFLCFLFILFPLLSLLPSLLPLLFLCELKKLTIVDLEKERKNKKEIEGQKGGREKERERKEP